MLSATLLSEVSEDKKSIKGAQRQISGTTNRIAPFQDLEAAPSDQIVPTDLVSVQANQIVPTNLLSVQANHIVPTDLLSVQANQIVPTDLLSVQANQIVPTDLRQTLKLKLLTHKSRTLYA